ncbi:MAG: hypothetical protein KGZ74_19390 [Chitinophagaceae bacterium]|nr:hypothetical protein [Chitinophagaceae bacterium]
MSNTSGAAIEDAFNRIILSQIPNQRWLGKKNYYVKETKKRVNKATLSDLKKKQIEEYIAASVIIHCSDGWTYLTRAVDSLINGDIASSIHFAYYAELRSAMSLMAFEGVGIFDKQHIWFDSSKNARLFKSFTTHSAADSGMKEWAKLSTKKNVIFNFLRVNNRTFSDWIRETGFSSKNKYTTSILNRWLTSWSIDLHLKDDQDVRNEMSYRPHFTNSPIKIQATLSKLSELWNLLEPTPANRFPKLDQYLLRFTLEEIFRKSTGTEPTGVPFENFIRNIFSRLGEDQTQFLFDFLIRLKDRNDSVIFEEAKKDKVDSSINKQDPFPILCRAILLLRLSTGGANQLVTNSSVNVDQLRFWWEELSLQQGIITSIPSGIEAIDLYTDIRDSIDEINNKSSASLNCIKSAFENISEPLFYIKQFQRAAIWGLGM